MGIVGLGVKRVGSRFVQMLFWVLLERLRKVVSALGAVIAARFTGMVALATDRPVDSF